MGSTPWGIWEVPFEIGGSGRSLPLEGLRGVAVSLVFLHHYCMQYSRYTNISGFTEQFASVFRSFGGNGVDLFFVLSGFLIYRMLLRQRQSFIPFMVRRAQQLYPAFLVVFVIAIFWDFSRPERKIPADLNDATLYLTENIFFIPGLFPVDALFVTNWSLSYEWWFYVTITFLFSFCRLATLPTYWQISIILAASAVLIGLSASGPPHVPARGLSLFGGMLVAEASARNWRPVPAVWWINAVIITSLFCIMVLLSSLLCNLLVTACFCFVCFGALGGAPPHRSPLHLNICDGLGICLYSYYLIHGFVVVICVRGIIKLIIPEASNDMFWLFLLPTFAISLFVGALLFLCVERPYSLRKDFGKDESVPETAVHAG